MATARSDALRAKLRSVFGKAKVPTNPAIAAEILRLADDPTSTADQFAGVIRADVALSVRLLKMANASLFAQREPVTTIKRAVIILGLRRIRMVALGFQLVAHLDRLGGFPFDLKLFWQQSVLRGCLAREIAMKIVPGHAEEAFVVGLLQDCGILLLVQVLGRPYADLHASASLSPTAFYERERSEFPYDHVETISVLAGEWNLPELIAAPLGRHHTVQPIEPETSDLDRLVAVAYFVGSLPLMDVENLASSEPQLKVFATEELRLDARAMAECLQRAGEAYRQVGSLTPEHLPEDLDVTELLDQANRHLARAASEAEDRADVVEAERDRIRREHMHLRSALGQYRERAAHDPLTRLLNRGALMEATLSSIRASRDRGQALAVYFLDIDDFKVINDEHGHLVGDEVLRVLAGALSEAVVTSGFAGRYGGEEFVVVIPGLHEHEARLRARTLVERVRQIRHEALPSGRAVTCSIGAVWGRPRPGTSPADLFTAADELMYQAKLGGKDHCCYKSLERPGAVHVLSPTSEADAPVRKEEEEPTGRQATVEELRQLALALNRAEPRRFATMRKRERHPLIAPAQVNCFTTGSSELRGHPGFVRNISTGGVGVLTTRPMIRGEPVEVVIEPEVEGESILYVGGIVAHCRHIKNGIYEVGVQLVAQGRQPILSRDGGHDHLDWVIEALRSAGDGTPLRESA